ncbi:MAG: hypothetical protein WKG32_19800 [Gemmatimonadaceae bacterium]
MRSVWRVACVRIPRFPIGAVWRGAWGAKPRAGSASPPGDAQLALPLALPFPFPPASPGPGTRAGSASARGASGEAPGSAATPTPGDDALAASWDAGWDERPLALAAPPARPAARAAHPTHVDSHAARPLELGGAARLRAVSKGAAQRRVRHGMTVAEARALCAELEVGVWDDVAIASATDRVTAALLEASPQVTPVAGRPGTWWVGAAGFDGIGGERELLRALLALARRWHPDARVAIAGSCVAACAATWDARQGRRGGTQPGRLVPPGEDAAYLATAPLELIPIADELREALVSLGIRSVGAFAALDLADVERRWGSAGMLAWRLARGEDARRPVLARAESPRSVEAELASPAETMEPALFLVRAALESLVRALVAEGKGATALAITLTLDSARSALPTGVTAHTVTREARLPHPVARVAPLWEHCRSLLERWQLSAPLCGVTVSVVRTAAASAEQGDLLAGSWRDPGAADAAFARLRAELGPGSVVRPAARDEHRPDRAGAWVDVVGTQRDSALGRVPAEGGRMHSALNGCGSRRNGDGESPPRRDRAVRGGPPKVVFAQSRRAPSPDEALRLLETPEPVEVEYSAGVPSAMWWRGSRLAIERAAGPERRAGDWWKEGYARDYWRCVGAAGDWMLFLGGDRGARGWYVQGWYD